MKTEADKLGTATNLGITEHDGVDLTLQKHHVNAVFPCTGNQYFMFSDSKKQKMVTIQGKRILKILEKELEKILHDNLEENNAEKQTP